MEAEVLIGAVAVLLALASGAALIYFLSSGRGSELRSLMSSGGSTGTVAQGGRGKRDMTDDELRRLKDETERRLRKQKPVLTLEQRFFQAGVFSDEQKRRFKLIRVLGPVLGTIGGSLGIGLLTGDASFALIGLILGGLIGFQVPISLLDRRVKHRGEEIMYYLPLVIEQIAIGVSSSLDIGPCLQRVVSMADERDSHNVVTELLKITQHYIKTGVPLEDAFTEVGKLSGHTELKHAFMSLAQVAKHGGEISRQLQELADAVSTQRETAIDAKIKKLELAATGPVALVFFGFLIILLIGFGLQVMKGFES